MATLLAAVNANAQDQNHCIVIPDPPLILQREPTNLSGLNIDIGLASEGFLMIGGAVVGSPTGDNSFSVGPYDPSSGRLYIWGYWKNGWVNIQTLESNEIQPILYSTTGDIEDVTEIERSEALGVQFYSGWTYPHWLTGRQSYRVFALSGTEMNRVEVLEELQLHYVGDIPELNLAVFSGGVSSSVQSNHLAWFDGTQIVTRADGLDLPDRLCQGSE